MLCKDSTQGTLKKLEKGENSKTGPGSIEPLPSNLGDTKLKLCKPMCTLILLFGPLFV